MLRRPPTAYTLKPSDVADLQASLAQRAHSSQTPPQHGGTVASTQASTSGSQHAAQEDLAARERREREEREARGQRARVVGSNAAIGVGGAGEWRTVEAEIVRRGPPA
ncbi:hypothetical protein JCM8097_009567 [Rhodosporidiobolus ruineniae]